jgi:uncharacterized caspase-like protein
VKTRVLCIVIVLLASQPVLQAQMSDRCSPGWSMLNRLREQLTPETPIETLQLIQVSIAKRLANCREIPDLWYYRALVEEQLRDFKDAAYSRKEAKSGGSAALAANINPFVRAVETPAAALSAQIGEKYALVVGINQFEHKNALRFAVNDAKSFAELLSDQRVGHFREDNITRLFNEDATLEGFRTAIGRIRQVAKPEDLVVVYIASHGSPRMQFQNGVSFVIMHDTKDDTAANLYGTSLQMIDLVEILRRDVRAKRVVLLLDTCFSGDATGASGANVYSADRDLGPQSEFSVAADRFEDKTPKGVARVVISASRADELSWEDARLHHGYFTYFLLEALRENGGAISLGDVFQSVHDNTAKAVQRARAGTSQTPTMRNTPEGASIVLGALPVSSN